MSAKNDNQGNQQVIVLEPYFGGSHRIFLEGLQHHLHCPVQMLTLPAHSWKWRMRLAAPWFAKEPAALLCRRP